MEPKQPEKYTTCARCGKKILEKCAIEDSGKVLCGDCVVLNTDKEVQETERIIKQQRKEEYELERKHILKKQRQRTFYVFIVCLIFLGLVQIFNYMNRPEPVKSVRIDLQKDRETIRSLLIFALNSYQNDHQGTVPESLDQLFPHYLSKELQPHLDNFDYEKKGSSTFSIKVRKNQTP